MTTQDVAALVVCAVAALWLVRRLFLSYGPPSKRPDVTARSLVKRTRQKQAERASGERPPPPPRDCH